MQLRQGTTLQGGKYRIIRVLGQGGFGITYLAEHTMLDKMVAIKEFFPKEYCDRDATTSHITLGTKSSSEIVAQLKTKFIKEAKNISKLSHHNIITIHDIFQENETAYYVMEYVEGESLGEMIKRVGVLSEGLALRYIRKIADALGYMHSLSMNHLDLKPANVMVRRSDDEPILIDFGLSKQYDAAGDQTTSTPIGISHGFAPMEQYRPGGVATFTPQTDIYALGATLFALLKGETPPHYSDILEDGLPDLPTSVSSNVNNAVAHAMEIRKNKRPSSIADFLSELNDSSETTSHQTNGVRKEHSASAASISSSDPSSVEETIFLGDIREHQSHTPHALEKVKAKGRKPVIIDGIEFVDLGLSVMWANKNVGADKSYDPGMYINKLVDEDIKQVVHYNLTGAAIPTIDQWEELKNRCRWESTEVDAQGGYMVYGPNGNSIFLPLTGDESFMNYRSYGLLFTRETFYKGEEAPGGYFFYYRRGGEYKTVQYMCNYACPVRLIVNPKK